MATVSQRDWPHIDKGKDCICLAIWHVQSRVPHPQSPRPECQTPSQLEYGWLGFISQMFKSAEKSGLFRLTAPHPHFGFLDNLSTKTTWQMKAVLCGQALLPPRVLKSHIQVMASSEVLNAEQPKLSPKLFFFTCSPFCFVKIFL